MKTRALRVTAPETLEAVELDLEAPGPGEVQIRLIAGGVCGTDVHVFAGHMPPLPRIPGHDVAGEITAVGNGIATSRLGERVTVDPAACCARSSARAAGEDVALCSRCAEGRTHLCRDGSYLGIQEDGAFRSHLNVSALRAVPLAPEISWTAATVLEPVVVALHLMERVADRHGPALVIGGGPIGLVAARLLLAERDVLLVEPRPARRDLASRWGIESCAPEELRGLHEATLLVEASGHPSATELLLRTASKGSTVVLIGGATDIPGREILTRELEVRAIKGGRGLYAEAIRRTVDLRLPLDDLNSHHVSASRAADIFAALYSGQPEGDGREILRAVLDLTKF